MKLQDLSVLEGREWLDVSGRGIPPPQGTVIRSCWFGVLEVWVLYW